MGGSGVERHVAREGANKRYVFWMSKSESHHQLT